jgi:hypothetical protein
MLVPDDKSSEYQERLPIRRVGFSFPRSHNLRAIETVCHDLQKHSKNLISLERFLRLRGVKEENIDQLLKGLMATNYEDFSQKGKTLASFSIQRGRRVPQ